MSRAQPHAYLEALFAHTERSPIGPGVHHVEVRHDPGCGLFHNRPCDCEPEIESGVRVDRKYGGEKRGIREASEEGSHDRLP